MVSFHDPKIWSKQDINLTTEQKIEMHFGPPLEVSGTKKMIDSKRRSVDAYNLQKLRRDFDQ